MGCDMIVALGQATVNGHTLIGLNSHRLPRQGQTLCLQKGRPFALGETLRTQHLVLPQARQVFTVLGSQPLGCWGYQHGLNEFQVAIGCSSWQSKLESANPCLTGPDLVRLALERSRNACQALELLTDLISRHGQGRFPSCPEATADHVFLIADAQEAYAVEAAGSFWAWHECHDIRAMSDLCLVRQDWQRLAPGLAGEVIAKGWWQDDGSKLDFASSLHQAAPEEKLAWKRWGRATRLLEEQNGHIDAQFIRRLLRDHFEGTANEVDPLDPLAVGQPLCQHGCGNRWATAASCVAELSGQADHPVLAWCAFGPPCHHVYFPIFLDGEMPEVFAQADALGRPDSPWWRFRQLLAMLGTNPARWAFLHDCLENLQARFDQEAEEFVLEAADWKRTDQPDKLHRLASLLMQNHLELFEAELARVQSSIGRLPAAAKLKSLEQQAAAEEVEAELS